MAGVITVYDNGPQYLLDTTVQWDSGPIKCALVTSSYTPVSSHNQWSDVSANEVAGGSGYTTGGVTLAGAAVTPTTMTAPNPQWTALTKTFRYAVLYRSGTFNGVVNPLLLYILLDPAPADIVVSGTDYEIIFPSSVVFNLSTT